MGVKSRNTQDRRSGDGAVAVTVEGRWPKRLAVVGVLAAAVAAVVAFGLPAIDRPLVGDGPAAEVSAAAGAEGDLAGSTTDADNDGNSPIGSEAVGAEPDTDGSGTDGAAGQATTLDLRPAPSGPSVGAEASSTLRFVAFDQPIVLLDDETDPELNNSAGIDLTEVTVSAPADSETAADGDASTTEPASPPAALAADLVVFGPPGTSVSVHPGDRPGDALRFTIPASGRTLAPHLIAAADGEGRIVVSASDQVQVKMTGLGTFVPARQAAAGRFVSTNSVRIGSLVTATDGRELTIALQDVLGPDAAHVGQAVIRINANVGPTGGSVMVGDGDPIPWPAPASQDLGLAATDLLTVQPTADGEITIGYLGGSVMTVDLVGYYTNDAAPLSTTGLLVLAERPALQPLELGSDAGAPEAGGFTADQVSFRNGTTISALSRTIAVVEATNAGTGGTITFGSTDHPAAASSGFALAPNQRRITTEWLDLALGSSHSVEAPGGTTVQIWILGGFT